MNNELALECVKKEIIKYKLELRDSIIDEILGSSVIYGSTLSSAFIYSILRSETEFKALPYTVAILVSSIISLKNHYKYASSLDEKNTLIKLKKIRKSIISGANPFEDIEVEQFPDSLSKILKNNH